MSNLSKIINKVVQKIMFEILGTAELSADLDNSTGRLGLHHCKTLTYLYGGCILSFYESIPLTSKWI